MTEQKIARCRALRQSVISQLTLIIDAANAANGNPANYTEFKVRFRSLKKIINDFQKHHNSLLALVAENADQLKIENKTGTDFTKRCHEIETIYYELFELPLLDETGVLDRTLASMNNPNNDRVILPKITLPIFSGEIKDFATFIQTYDSLIHKNRSLSNIEKFNYLMTSLSGQALDVVSDIPILNENYLNAYNILINRFTNKRLQATTYWKVIEDTSHLKHEDAKLLRDLVDTFTKNLSSLKSMGFEVDHWDFILAYMLLDRLDINTRKAYEQSYASNEIPKFENVKDFIIKYSMALEAVPKKEINKFKPFQQHRAGNSQLHFKPGSKTFFTQNGQNTCFLCKGKHIIYRCPTFLDKSPQQRFDIIKKQRACVNCLATAHTSTQCTSENRCKTCRKEHHTLLHFIQNNSSLHSDANQNNTHKNDLQVDNSCASTSAMLSKTSQVSMSTNGGDVLLSTVLLKIKDIFNNFHTIRAILDSGAQSSFISLNCANKLGLQKFKLGLSLQGLGGMCATAKSGVNCTIGSLLNSDFTFDFHAVVLEKICEQIPAFSFSAKNLPFISNLKLSDPTFNESGKIDLLLGNDVFPYILQNGRLYNGPENPVCINTVFGWTLMGNIQTRPCLSETIKSFFITSSLSDLNNNLQNFWKIEEVPDVKVPSPEDAYCEKYFLDTTTKTETGRYMVSLPFKITAPDFGDTRSIALRRFLSLERRLLQNDEFYKTYSAVMQDYLDNNHMEPVSTPLTNNNNEYFYIAHHAVFKKDSSSTPLRVVFDASSHAPNKLSLNNALYTGPKLQRDIVQILLNFRLHNIVFTCDIRQMYRMILINPDQRNFQRILWRFSADQPVMDFQLNTVTFGVSCSPFLAIRTLLHLASEHKDLPLASQIIKKSVFVDDVVTGSNSFEEAIHIKDEIIELLGRAGFEARKWASNCPDLLSDLPASHIEQKSLCLDLDNTLKILGLKWNPQSDDFSYSIECLQKKCTKRTILSDLARIFDPLGYLTPSSLVIKLLIQSLWSQGLGWDDTPSPEIVMKWERLKMELQSLHNCKLPRQIKILNSSTIHLCGFCDSSERAYCAVIYIRIIYDNNTINTFFVCAKSKVAPLKRLSLPRLELCAAVLLAKLMNFVLNTFDHITFDKIYAFSDSTVTLNWIKSSPHRWKTFVSNRTAYIQEKIAPNYWYHVQSAQNPADCGSRGLFPSELVGFFLWWRGPEFLSKPDNTWNLLNINHSDSALTLQEQKRVVITTIISFDDIGNILDKYNSLSKIKRIIAYLLRSIEKFKNPKVQFPSYLTITELTNATFFISKYIQSLYFKKEIILLKNNRGVPKLLQKLNPFLDDKGIIRVGGRLCHSDLPYDKKFPVLLPGNTKFTELLITDIHTMFLHCGIQTTNFLLLQNFWILSSKKVIRKILYKCHTCWKTNPKPFQPPMGNLPKFRISQAKAFQNVGTDFCGPFSVTMGRVRGAKVTKAYICLFICCAVKAVHLELVSEMSSEAFLCALRRFIARRGLCLNIYSDCGSNFVGADKYLRQIFRECAEKVSVSWHFNPPSAPHMGGIWEANIKSMKTHLQRTVGTQILTYEELNTVIIQIESILNSRPLCPVSSDPTDLAVLTPGHFLSLQPLTALPDPDLTNMNLNRLNRWQLLQRIHRDFWIRWKREYLHTLQQRSKWNDPMSTVLPNTMVLIKEENIKPLEWILGRITQVITGSDNVPRVAIVKTAKGLLKRPLVKLCPLPN